MFINVVLSAFHAMVLCAGATAVFRGSLSSTALGILHHTEAKPVTLVLCPTVRVGVAEDVVEWSRIAASVTTAHRH